MRSSRPVSASSSLPTRSNVAAVVAELQKKIRESEVPEGYKPPTKAEAEAELARELQKKIRESEVPEGYKPPTKAEAEAELARELQKKIRESEVPEGHKPPTKAEAVAELAREVIESGVVFRKRISTRLERNRMEPNVLARLRSHREHNTQQQQVNPDVGDDRGNAQGEPAARADDFRESTSSAPLLLDGAAVPEPSNPQLVSPEHSGIAQHDEEEDDEFYYSSFDSESDDDYIATSSGYLCPDSNRSLKTSRVKSILQELLQNEANYVQTLGRGIENYVSIMGSNELPPGLRGQRYHIFGNIEKIHSLHQDQFLPMLERNQTSIQGIAETFIDFLERDMFYCYVMFALNRPKSEQICNRNLDFFQRRQVAMDERLGLNGFLLEPIQRLPRYKLLLAEINKEILKQMNGTLLEAVKDEIGTLCKAEKRLERFIDITNEAMHLREIQECYEERGCVHIKLLDVSHVADPNMSMILRPHTDRYPDKRRPIDLFNQGKFRKMLEVNIYDCEQRKRYPAKMFLFERSIIYTEKCYTHLEYRGRYEYSEIGRQLENCDKVLLFARQRGIHEIEVHCNDIIDAQRLDSYVERMGARVEQSEASPSVNPLQYHRQSDLSILSSSSGIGSDRESYESALQSAWHVTLKD